MSWDGETRLHCDGVSDPACVRRFWEKVTDPDENGCRRWTGALTRDGGAGQFAGGPRRAKNRRAKVVAHVFAWTLTHGEVPAGLEICHTCDVQDCCSVEHMRADTHEANMQDMVERFRSPRGGEGGPAAKLTHRQRAEVYDLAWSGHFYLREIAEMYGVSITLVHDIKTGRWCRYSVQLGRERAA